MSGQGNRVNFEVVGDSDDTVVIAGKPIASGTPTDGQVLIYSAADGHWKWRDKPVVSVFQASGLASVTPVTATDIAIDTDVTVEGTDIVRASGTTFTLQPGSYRAAFFCRQASFASDGAAQQVTYNFFNQTAGAAVGPLGEVEGFDFARTTVCGIGIETVIKLAVQSNISVRVVLASATTPVLVSPNVSFNKLT